MPDPAEELEEQIDALKAGLVAITRGANTKYSSDEYRATRKTLVGHPKLRALMPDWLRTASTMEEANRIIRRRADENPRPGGKWATREALVSEELNVVVQALQDDSAVFESTGELGERIGGGGFGEVYRWHHQLLDMDFAVKVLNPSFAQASERYLDRFFREARILFTFDHPGIVRVHDVGMYGRRPYIRMDLLVGQDVNGVLMNQGPLDADAAASLVLRVAEALEHAHERNVVHRDIRPSNVFVGNNGRVYLIDFGLGAFVEGDLISRVTRTGEGVVGGYYTAPELVADPRLLNPQTDIYSLGALWFTLVTGRPPAGTAVESEIRANSAMPPEHGKTLLRALAGPDRRHASATELIDGLRALIE